MFRPPSWRRVFRPGLSAVQVTLVVAVVAILMLVGMRAMTQNVVTELNATSEDLADPAELAARFH